MAIREERVELARMAKYTWEADRVGLALVGLYEVITRTDKDWRKFARSLRCAYSGPPPLLIDGHEYHRRQRRRTKQKGKR